eukprot:1034099-Pleurochrysis_carterae.AAC.1
MPRPSGSYANAQTQWELYEDDPIELSASPRKRPFVIHVFFRLEAQGMDRRHQVRHQRVPENLSRRWLLPPQYVTSRRHDRGTPGAAAELH